MGQLTISYLYPCKRTETPVTIDVKIGFAQLSNIKIKQVNKILIEDVPTVENLELGTNKKLKGKEIKCTVDIIDIQAATNKVGVEITLKGGQHDQQFLLENELAPGDPVMFYTVKILFL
ncbi:MAG: hypothetical protein IPJ82_13545 [Lewinellaceae bacterium]|nr:hypothetical protein [Lewinellaceae bacterium]